MTVQYKSNCKGHTLIIFQILSSTQTTYCVNLMQNVQEKGKRKPRTDAIRTKVPTSKPEWETRKFTNRHNTKICLF